MKTLASINVKKLRVCLAVLAVVALIFIAYGQTLGFYFYQDDSALMFKLQNPAGPAGSYGEGIIGGGAYKYLVTPFVLFFPLFGLNPFWYFLVGFIAYGISASVFFLFASELFKSRKAGFIAALIYGAGYIGSETMFRISNSWQTNFGLIFALLSFWSYTKFMRKNKIRFYLFALLFFYIAVEFVYVRSHSLIAVVLALDLFLTIIPVRISKIPGILLRQAPFWIIFYNWYIKSNSFGDAGLKNLMENIFGGRIEEISTRFFATIGNIFMPSKLQEKIFVHNILRDNLLLDQVLIDQLVLLLIVILISHFLMTLFSAGRRLKITSISVFTSIFFLNCYFITKNFFWYRIGLDISAGALGMYIPVLAGFLALVLWKKMKELSIALILGIIVVISQFLGYFIQYQDAIFATTHRYLSYSFIGYCIIIGGITFAIFEKVVKSNNFGKFTYLLAVTPLFLFIGVNLFLGVIYQNKIIKNISRPTEAFYKNLKNYVPNVQKGDIFFFDVIDKRYYQQQFIDFFSVGSMPESTALAIYYGVDRYDIALTENFNELLYKISTKQIGINNIHSFYFGENGLEDTTNEVRNSLTRGSESQALSLKHESPSLISILRDNIKISSVSPLLLNLKAKIMPDISNITYPYSPSGKKFSTKTVGEKEEIIAYLLSRKEYYSNVKVSSLSQWKYQETENAVDNNINTSWRGHRIFWHEHQKEQITLDLGRIKRVGKLIWTNWNNTLTPTSYVISVSKDKNKWEDVKKVVHGPERKSGEIVTDAFDEIEGRYVRMDITETLVNDAPALTELEVVESAYNDIDLADAFSFLDSPFDFIANEEELNLILKNIAPLLNIEINWNTNKGKNLKKITVGNLDRENIYELPLDTGGTVVQDLKISVPGAPVKIEIQSISLRNLDFNEISDRGLIKKFVEN